MFYFGPFVPLLDWTSCLAGISWRRQGDSRVFVGRRICSDDVFGSRLSTLGSICCSADARGNPLCLHAPRLLFAAFFRSCLTISRFMLHLRFPCPLLAVSVQLPFEVLLSSLVVCLGTLRYSWAGVISVVVFRL